MNLVRAASRELRGTTAVTSYAALGSSTEWGPWIFQNKERVSLEGNGKALVVLAQRAGMPGNRMNTWRFPRLQVTIYADVPRNEDLNPSGTTAEEVCEELFVLIDRVFHRPDAGGFVWGNPDGLRIVESTRGSELDTVDVPGGDGMVRGIATYEVVW